MASIAKVPANLPITVTVGADFALALTASIDGDPYDFTNATVTAVILDSTGSALPTTFTTSVAGDTLTLTLTDTQTTTLGQGVYSYAVNVTKDNTTDPWLAGTLSLVPLGRGGVSSATASLSITTAPGIDVEIFTGIAGNAASVTVGTTTTSAPGGDAEVTNSGDTSAAVLDFVIPRGNTGPQGPQGDPATVAVGDVSTGAAGSSATVTNVGTPTDAILDFAIPRGDKGDQGDKGDKGDTGNTGATGAAGAAATIAVGTTSTLSAGASATVTNSGSSSSAVFNFGIPQGAKGDKGDKGDTGNTGATGAAGAAGQWDTAQTTATKSDSYVLLTADAGKLILMDKGTAQNVTVDGSLDLTTGQRIDVIQTGAGQVTFVASSATVNGTPGLKLRARYSAATVICVGTDSYVVVGDLSV